MMVCIYILYYKLYPYVARIMDIYYLQDKYSTQQAAADGKKIYYTKSSCNKIQIILLILLS